MLKMWKTGNNGKPTDGPCGSLRSAGSCGTFRLFGASLSDLRGLLPHRPPLLLLTSLEESQADAARARVVLDPDGWGCEGGAPAPELLIECAAQAAAASAGMTARQTGARAGFGMLVGVRRFTFPAPATCGEELSVAVRIVHRLGPLHLVEATLQQAGVCVARGHLKVFVEADDAP